MDDLLAVTIIVVLPGNQLNHNMPGPASRTRSMLYLYSRQIRQLPDLYKIHDHNNDEVICRVYCASYM